MIRFCFTFLVILLEVGPLQSQVDSTLHTLLKKLPKDTEISIGTYDNGKIDKQGFILKKGQLQPINNMHKLFEIGSLTKVFTTLTALKILNRKNISTNGSIAPYFPKKIADRVNSITFQQLMTHTAGFPKMPNNFIWSALKRPSDPFLPYKEKQLLHYLNKRFQPKQKPTFKYSNFGMGLLGYLIRAIEHKDLGDIYEQEIFLPLGMVHSSLGIQKDQYGIVASPKNRKGIPKRTWQFSQETAGAGALFSTIDNLTLFLDAVLQKNHADTLLNQSLEQMETVQHEIDSTSAMGLGWRINLAEPVVYYHGGITYGFKSMLAINLETKKGIVILTNAKGLSRKENAILKEVCFEFMSTFD